MASFQVIPGLVRPSYDRTNPTYPTSYWGELIHSLIESTWCHHGSIVGADDAATIVVTGYGPVIFANKKKTVSQVEVS